MPLRPIDFLSTFFLSLCIPFTTYAQHDSLRISLDELFARGAEQHLQLHADRLKEQMAEERIRDARTARMPDISIGLKGGVLGQPVVWQSGLNDPTRPDTPDWQQNYTVDFTQPLYQGGKIKYSIRKAGLELGIPEKLVFRQPFPGPGLGIRIIGEVTAEKVRIVQDADYIYREEVDAAVEEYRKEHGEAPEWMPNQYFAALTNMRSVGVMGDERTYDYAVALRAVNTVDFMTAEAANIPFEVLQKVMSRIINEVKGVNRCFYDITSKPPGTIEFE